MPRLGRGRTLVFLVVLASLGLAAGTRAQSNTPAWRFAGNVGRGSGGPVIALRDSSTDSLYLLHEADGSSLTQAFLWRSDDFGVSWNALRSSSPNTLVSLKADPFRSGAVFALHVTAIGELQLWESDDRGRRWQVNGGPATEAYGDSATLVVSPQVPDRLYVSGQGLWRSEDRGKTWELLSSVARSGLVEHPSDPEVLVAIVPWLPLLMRSVDGGRHWHLLSQVLEEGSLWDFAIAPSEPERVYATSTRGVLRSDDGGRTWRVVRQLEPYSCLLSTVDPGDSDRLVLADWCFGRVLASRDGGEEWSELRLPRRGGGSSFAIGPRDLDDLWFTNGELRHSLDGGSTSTAVPTPVPGGELVRFLDGRSVIYAASASGLWRPAGDGSAWHRRGKLPPTGYPVAVDPHRPQIIYYSDYAALWRSLDGGKTFAQIPSQLASGIDQLICDRHHPGRLLAATYEDAWRSDDGGVRWTKFTSGIPTGLADGHHGATFPSRRVSRIVQDATDRNTLYVVREDELFVSTDGGTAWRRRRFAVALESLTADPIRSRTIYQLSTFPPTLHQSLDAGRNWTSSPLPVDPGTYLRPELRFDGRGNLAIFTADAQDCSALAWPIVREARDDARWRRLGARLPSGCLRDLVAGAAPDGGIRWFAAIDGAGTWRLDPAESPARDR